LKQSETQESCKVYREVDFTDNEMIPKKRFLIFK